MTELVTIDKRFHGPCESGNGGYSCGLVGKFIEGDAAVRLRVPPPLDTPMDVRVKHGCVELVNNDELVAKGKSATVEIDIPEPPEFADAQVASSRYRGFESHFYPTCFVCGPERESGDGLRIFAGPIEHSSGPDGLVAATWVPDLSLADSFGQISTEYIWAALDCPGAYAFAEPSNGAILLGELAVSIRGPVSVGEKCVLLGWEISHVGRKHFTGTALFGESGLCCGVGYATWFEVLSTPEQ
jgi:hypothetical protein